MSTAPVFPALRPGAFDIVDAQLHLTLEFTEEKILAGMDALGIQAAVIDEFWGINDKMQGTPCIAFADGAYRPVSPYAQAAALKHPERFAFLQRVERRDPDLAAHVGLLAATPACRALRLTLLHPGERQAFASGGHDTLLGLAQQHRLPVCVLSVQPAPLLKEVAPRFPELTFVLDHCGWPKSAQDWEAVLQLASLPNVCLKWCHAFKPFARGEQPRQALQREFERAVETFGVDRMLWAGDVTHEDSGASWAQLLDFVLHNPALSRADKAALLGGTARRLFRWDAPKCARSAAS